MPINYRRAVIDWLIRGLADQATSLRGRTIMSRRAKGAVHGNRRPARSLRLAVLFTGAFTVHGFSAASAAAFTDPVWVSFASAAAVPSALAQRVLGDAVHAARPTANLRGLLVVPEGEGPFPAVVLLHGCRGVLPSHRGWAQWLARQGYVALLVDSFFTRNAVNVCGRGFDEGASQEVGGRVFDAFGALQYLRSDPRVDPQRIAVIGWQSWAPLSAVAHAGPRLLMQGAFRAAVAVSPQCPLRAADSGAPVLIVIGEKDRWHSAHACERLADHSGSAIEVLVLPDAGHGFDEVSARGGLFVSVAFNTQLGHAAQVPLRYDGHAHEHAAQSILQFLRRELLTGDESSNSVPSVFRLPAGVRWAVDPAEPGADLPPRGQSLFDRVFANGKGGHHVPYPFSNVLDTLERAIGVPLGSREGLASALIPIGRSLQRSAAAPEFFRFPRLVIAVDGQPANRPRAHFLKDRLFLGYHEKAAVIEVISFNEEAARFEYQVVDNYTSQSAPPRVRYANRALCVSCHQNQAPIFSRAAWDETNANRHIARRLRAQRAQFYGVTVRAGGAPAARVDNATDRANLLPALQLLWRQGCGGTDAGAARCRAAALVAMVQYRLSSAAGYERDDPLYQRHFAAQFERHWARLSPGGLAIPQADLLNREPLLEPLPIEIDAHLDPLTAREPAAVWDLQQATRRLISELSQSIPEADLAALDAHLRAPAQRANAPRQEVVLPCTITRGALSGRNALIQVRCAQTAGDARRSMMTPYPDSAATPYATSTWESSANASQLAAAFAAPRLSMELNVAGGRVLDGLVSQITLPGGDRFERIRAFAGTIGEDADGWRHVRVQLRQRNGWSVRDHRGHALEQITLRWAVGAASDAGRYDGSVQMRMVADFAPLRGAVYSMLASAGASGDAASEQGAFGDRGFIPTQVLNAVLRHLHPGAHRWCCEVPGLPALALAGDAPGAQLASAANAGEDIVSSFRRHCGACHAGPTQAPPGFLHGSDAEAMVSIRQCAPRIAFRLGMWLRAESERTRSPMPPPAILPSRGLDQMSWRNSVAFDRLLRWAEVQSASSPEPGQDSRSPLGLARCLTAEFAALHGSH